jgi:hypothetical protein
MHQLLTQSSVNNPLKPIKFGTSTIYRKRVKIWHRDLLDLEAMDPLRQLFYYSLFCFMSTQPWKWGQGKVTHVWLKYTP